jgi:NAD(P)-dependent dehydrogenase (short-subunit alcohol dehydrogenase family)
MKSYEGKVVLVTGANSGIGEASVVGFAQAGARVYGLARRVDALEAARAKHPDVRWLLADVARAADVKAAVTSVVDRAGRLDVLVNNAAAFTLGPLESVTEEILRTVFEVNVFGVTYAAQAALPALVGTKGSIVNVSSTAGHKPIANGSIYGATKAAIESLTQSWALELAPKGVRVNCIAPGPTETAAFDKMTPPDKVDQVKAQFAAQVPLGRIASPAEVARWIVAIADPSVTWITGAVLAIDGGMSLS